jgi:hypothetical protein
MSLISFSSFFRVCSSTSSSSKFIHYFINVGVFPQFGEEFVLIKEDFYDLLGV